MQVSFDSAFVGYETKLKTKKQGVENKSRGLYRTILEAQTKNETDFESLTLLYRQIFQLLLIYAEVESGNRPVEREIAAALESVFPRVGLKAFMDLPNDEKKHQLTELDNIVKGIRLFNRDLGKGGSGLEDIGSVARREVVSLKARMLSELNEITDLCQQYTDVLVYFQIYKPEEAQSNYVQRWQEELTNRRQYLSFIQSLHEDVSACQDRIVATSDTFRREMDDLKALVGSRTSVPKEQVYPKFDTLAKLYEDLRNERDLYVGRETCWKTLQTQKNAYEPTLSAPIISTARNAGPPTSEQLARSFTTVESPKGAAVSPKGNEFNRATGLPEDTTGEAPVRLSIKSTPEFMQLPLEYQGYCPWTIVHRHGLLLPGNPSVGVIRYRNSFNVFVHEEALQAFIKNPMFYVHGVLLAARQRPELIHLLRLQEQFPNSSLLSIVRGKKGVGTSVSNQQVLKVDKATGTPTHFIERNIDPNYEWNEWALRRKALQVTTLRNCKTESTQTNRSHFRSEAETQVYLPKIAATQTGINKGINPIRRHNFITGLRGSTSDPTHFDSHDHLTKFAKGPKEGEEKKEEKGKGKHLAAVVSLELEL
jgi:hypothetical protein